MKRKSVVALLVLVLPLILGCPNDTPPPNGGVSYGWLLSTNTKNGNQLVQAPSVIVDGRWISGGVGLINPFQSETDAHGLFFEAGLAAPAIWNLTWAQGNPTICDGSSVNAPVTSGGTVSLVCITSGVQASAGFSFSPFVVYAPAAPTAATIAGSGFNPTYGMPLVQYFSPNGTLVAQETATSVSSDGTSIQISPGSLDFSTLIPGTYAGVLSNAGPNGTWNYVGDTAVSVLTPSVSIIGSLKTDSSSGYTDYGTVSAIVNGHMETVNYGPNLSPAGATACNISTALTNAFNSDSNSSTAAVSSGGSNGTDGSDLGCGLWITNKTSSTSGLVTTPNSQSNYGYMPLLGAPSFIAVPSQSVKASGGVTIVGNIQGVPNSDGTTSYNTGSVSVTANGFTKSVTYGSDQSNSDPYGILSDLATAFNNDANSPVTASVDSTSAAAPLLNLTSKAGPSSNLVITVGADTVSGPFPTQPSFVPLPSSLTATGSQSVTIVGSLQQDAAGDQDDSVVCMVINTIVHCAGYQSNPPPSTANAFASALATAFNSDSNSPVTASASGNVVTYTSKSGTTGSFTISLTSVQYNGVYMGPPSFIPILSGH